MDPLLTSLLRQASCESETTKLQPKSLAIGRYLWLAEVAKIGKETTILRSSKIKWLQICDHNLMEGSQMIPMYEEYKNALVFGSRHTFRMVLLTFKLNNFTPIRVQAGTKKSHPVGFLL